MSTAPKASSPLGERNTLLRGPFGWFFFGRTIDLAGSSMSTVALPLAVLQVSGRTDDLGIVLAANLVPTLVLLLVGGTVADKVHRRTLLIVSNGSVALLTGVTAIIFLTHHYHLILVAALAFVTGALTAFSNPALRGIIPELVRESALQQANALLAVSQNTVRILAPVFASVLVATAGGGWAIGLDALSFAAAALVFLRLPGSSRPPRAQRPLWRDLAEGWAIFRSLRWVVVMTISFALINAFNVGPWNVLGLSMISESNGPAGWGLVQSLRAAGLLLSSLVAVKFVFAHPLRYGRIWGALAALPLFTLAITENPIMVGAAALIGGLGFTLAAVTWETALQRAVPRESLSRIAAYDDLLSFIAIPISQVVAGPVATLIGAQALLLICAAGYVISSLGPLMQRQVRAA